MDLTKRQQEIFDFIRKYSAKYGYPPTVRDIGKAVGLASSSTVHAHLANLEKIGLLRRDPSKPRAIELLDRAVGSAVDSVRGMVRAEGLPLLGSVAAGQPADQQNCQHPNSNAVDTTLTPDTATTPAVTTTTSPLCSSAAAFSML